MSHNPLKGSVSDRPVGWAACAAGAHPSGPIRTAKGKLYAGQTDAAELHACVKPVAFGRVRDG
jgi:hypothetical protein